jgi:hypothetical protein
MKLDLSSFSFVELREKIYICDEIHLNESARKRNEALPSETLTERHHHHGRTFTPRYSAKFNV